MQIFGHIREFLRKIGVDKRKGAVDNNTKVNLEYIVKIFRVQNYYFFFILKGFRAVISKF